ncbi:MAG: SGNH/GDSL hydrolase family protein, partial [Verrucomicrobiae bacterium]
MTTLFTATAMLMATASAQVPVWNLKTNPIPDDLKTGHVEFKDGAAILNDGATFAVPASAFQDMNNFTVMIDAEFVISSETDRNYALLVSKTDKNDGFGIDVLYTKSYCSYHAFFNGIKFKENRIDFTPGKVQKFVIAAKSGVVSVYLNGSADAKYLQKIEPNDAPMWVGKPPAEGEAPLKPFKTVKITDLKVYGPDYTYALPGEKPPELFNIGGRNWCITTPKITDANRPRIFCYGDSISMGYVPPLRKALDGKVYVDHWIGFVNGTSARDMILDNFKEAAAAGPYDILFINNGLHSLQWTPDKVSDEAIIITTRNIVRSFKAGAPQARIIWLQTTPQTAKRSGPDQKVHALGELN